MDTRRAVMAFFLAACVVMTALSLGVHRADAQTNAKHRVGVYDNRAIAVAFAHSRLKGEGMTQWKARYDKAERDGDEKEMARVKQAMDRMQWLTHRQGFGRASVDEAMSHVKGQLAEVAKQANVDLIVWNPDFVGDSVETVDLTDQIVALFDPNERVLDIVASLKKSEPVEVGYDFED